MNLRKTLLLAAGIAILAGLTMQQATAQNAAPKFLNPTQALDSNAQNTTPSPVSKKSFLASWWSGKGATANWLGLGKKSEDYGLTVTGDWQGNYYGNTTGGYRTGSAFDEQIKLGFAYDFGKVFGLTGLKAYSNLRYRDGNDINNITGAANGFNPSNIQSGKELRLMAQYLEYTPL
jgi:hypothetical protein